MRNKKAIVWFQKDLRLHDNEALSEAFVNSDEVIPVYVFDSREFLGKTWNFEFQKTAYGRTHFLIDAVRSLRDNLRKHGSDLVIRFGIVEEELFSLARMLNVDAVYCNRERTYEEVKIQEELEKKLWTIGREIRYSRGKMMYYTSDLPFPITHTPENFSSFRKSVERYTRIRNPLPIPAITSFKREDILHLEDIPTGLTHIPKDALMPDIFEGGEEAALGFMDKLIESYSNTKDLESAQYSFDKMLPWLSSGCISAKMVFHKIRTADEQCPMPELKDFVFTKLLWRDFYRLMGKKYGNAIFKKGGVKNSPLSLKDDEKLLQLWIEGRTGFPYMDACMRQIAKKYWLAEPSRFLVSSFLIYVLKVNWQMGAEYFESQLLDYDPCSNYGKWNYVAGISSDTKDGYECNILYQSQKLDPSGDYIRRWIPELAQIPDSKIHRPDLLTTAELASYGVKLGQTYPSPMINPVRWAK